MNNDFYCDADGYNWPIHNPEQPRVQPQQFEFINYQPVVLDASRLNIPPPTPRAPFAPAPVQNTPSAPAPESEPRSGRHPSKPFKAAELFDILQTAINVEFFTAKHREKGAKLRSSGMLSARSIFKVAMRYLSSASRTSCSTMRYVVCKLYLPFADYSTRSVGP